MKKRPISSFLINKLKIYSNIHKDRVIVAIQLMDPLFLQKRGSTDISRIHSRLISNGMITALDKVIKSIDIIVIL